MSDFTGLLQQMADRGDEVNLGNPDDIRERGDRRRHRTAARWAASAVVAIVVFGGTWIAGGKLDQSAPPAPTNHGSTPSTWNAQPVKPPLPGGADPDLGAKDYRLQGLATADDLYVLVGNTQSGGHAWLSPNGSSWAEPFETNAPKARFLMDIVDTGSGFLTVGQDTARHPAIWSSTDGFVWTPRQLYSPDGLTGAIEGISAAPNGWVAWGTVHGPATGTDGYIWRSSDAVDWFPAGDQSVFAGPGWQDILSVQATDFGWTAVGRDESTGFKDSFAKWTAGDTGEGWSSPSPSPDAVILDRETMHLMATGPKGSPKLVPGPDGFILAMPS